MHDTAPPASYSGDWYTLGQWGDLRITIGYYIDALTVAMFAMVTLIATCIHFYATGAETWMWRVAAAATVVAFVALLGSEWLERRGRVHEHA